MSPEHNRNALSETLQRGNIIIIIIIIITNISITVSAELWLAGLPAEESEQG